MPITVKHGGGDATALARLALLLGMNQAQAPQLPRMPGIPSPISIPGGGGGRGGTRRGQPLGRFGGPMRAAGSGGLNEREQLRRESEELERRERFGLPNKVKEMEEQSRIEVEQLGLELSARDKQEEASLIAAEKKLLADPNFTDDEKVTGVREMRKRRNGLGESIPSRVFKWPKLLGEDGQEIPRGLGNIYRHPESGALVRDVMTKDGPKVEVVQRYDQGPEAAKRKIEAERIEHERELIEKQRERREDLRADLFREKIKGEDPKTGKPTESRRSREEVEAIMRDIYPEARQEVPQQGAGTEQPFQPLGHVPQYPENDKEWRELASKEGWTVVEDEDKNVPGEAAYSKAVLRTISEHPQFKGKELSELPEEVQRLVEYHGNIYQKHLRDYARYRKQKRSKK